MKWDQWHKLVTKVTKKIKAEFQPHIIVPSMNGGLIPATIIAKQLKINDIRPVSVGRKNKNKFFIYPKNGNIENVKNKNILIVEDDAHSGGSLLFIQKKLLKRGARNIKIACVFKRKNLKKIDYFAKEVTKFPLYPWKKPSFGDRTK